MSHTTETKTQIKKIDALRRACRKNGWELAENQKRVRLYQGEVACDVSVRLPGWSYPVAIDTQSGAVKYDNYNGAWGDIKYLEDLTQAYGVAVVEDEIEDLLMQGYAVDQVTLPNGDIQLTVSNGV